MGRRNAGPLPHGGKCLGRETLLASQHTHEELVAGAHMRREAKKALVPAVVAHCKRDRPAMCASVLTGASPPMRACVSGPC